MGCAASSEPRKTGPEYGQYSMLGNYHQKQEETKPQQQTNGGPPPAPEDERLYHTDTEDEDENRLTPPPPIADPNKPKEEEQVQKKEEQTPPPPPVLLQKKEEEVPPPPVEEKEEETPPPAPPVEEKEEETPPPEPPVEEKEEEIPPPAPPVEEKEEETPPPAPLVSESSSVEPQPSDDINAGPGIEGVVAAKAVASEMKEDMQRRLGVDVMVAKEELEMERYTSPGKNEPPKFGEGYVQNDIGQNEMHLDFRKHPEDFDYETRPEVAPGQLYVDHDFPLNVAMGSEHGRKPLEWKRPPEFASDPCLFSDGTSRYDIGQGSIGTCWFLSSVSNVADKPQLLRRIIPRDSYPVGTPQYDGIFHCRFWRFGYWDDVFIDDYLPIIYGNQIYSAHSNTDPSEMWVALLEKAFSRMYGSYTDVSGGMAADSYMALTGGVPEDINLKKMTMEPEQLHSRVRHALSSGAAVTCSVPSEFDGHHGLVGGHEYSLTGAVMANGIRLFRVRNPWGNTEWTGPYSDGSREWQSLPKDIIDAPNKDDGEFYISLDHFLNFFSTLTICNITPDFDSDGSSDSLKYCTSLYGKWEGEEAAGFREKIKNPKFQFTVDESSIDENGNVPFVVQIIQRTKQRKAKKVNIRADLYRVLESESNDLLVLQEEGIPSKNNNYRGDSQTSFRFCLHPGKYVCIPSTMEEGQEKEFMLRLYSAGPLGDIKKIDSNEKTVMNCSGEGAEKYSHIKCVTGQWTAGSNAGGQVSHSSFHINPQIKIDIPSSQKVKIQLLSSSSDPEYPIGFKLFQVDGDPVPASLDWLYEHYGNATKTVDRDDGPFVMGTSAPAEYSLNAGSYICLLHMDQPDTEKRFAVVIRSSTPLDNIETHQME
ncbi:calpain clp-1-like [Saccostrea echinata]|uniref:calpain clp-1-like n=1 Tax=Saccostrea echinata TaxID=191078 RepID=UPI002A83F750|nr:calpain clp-1-like [Saccostrea echinata]